MCGIAGVLSDDKKISANILEKMGESIWHRGKDGKGLYIQNNIGLIHNRLSIIDIKSGGQPLYNEDQSIVIIFNGAIYNYIELRQMLIQQGHKFRTNSDTEVIVHCYEQYGENCLKFLNGMFAFAIFDSNKNECFLARDRLGIKPLYYYFDNQIFVFASEIKAIFASGFLKKEMNINGILDYTLFQFTLKDKTMFKNIVKLQPGHFMRFHLSSFTFEIKQYWEIKYKIDYGRTEESYVEELKYLLSDAAKLRLRADVPIGSHLSGGLDSSAVTVLASRLLLPNTLQTFTGKFLEGTQYDESVYAKAVCDYSNAVYNEIIISNESFDKKIRDIIYLMDEPSMGPGIYSQYVVSQAIGKEVKVVLGGQGGDELFGGYARYLVAYLGHCIKNSISGIKSADMELDDISVNLKSLKNYANLINNSLKIDILSEADERYFSLINRSSDFKNIFSQDFLSTNYSVLDEFKSIFNKYEESSYLNKMLYFDSKTSLPALLSVEDRTSMAYSIESRLPILDYRICEFISSVPTNIKFKNGENKYLFKEAIKGIIPDKVLYRQDKMGFPVPFVEWTKKELRAYIRETLLCKKAKERGIYNIKSIENLLENETTYGRSIWGILCLETWFDINFN